MAHLAPNYEERQEFWKPAVAPRHEAAAAEATDQVCQECGTDFVLGSRFCYVCGADRHANLAANAVSGVRAWVDFASLREALGQSNASLVALVLGFACVIAAIVTGFVFTATVASKGISAGGLNGGVGFTIRLSDSGWKFYVESRYHYAFSNIPSTLVPVTFGLRFN